MANPIAVNSGDLLKTSLITMSSAQQKVLSQSFLKESIRSAYFSSLCGKIAIISAALGTAAAFYNVKINKNITHAPSQPSKDKAQEKDVSWASTFAALGALSTLFFTYSWFSHSAESMRLKDLSEFITEWVSEIK